MPSIQNAVDLASKWSVPIVSIFVSSHKCWREDILIPTTAPAIILVGEHAETKLYGSITSENCEKDIKIRNISFVDPLDDGQSSNRQYLLSLNNHSVSVNDCSFKNGSVNIAASEHVYLNNNRFVNEKKISAKCSISIFSSSSSSPPYIMNAFLFGLWSWENKDKCQMAGIFFSP